MTEQVKRIKHDWSTGELVSTEEILTAQEIAELGITPLEATDETPSPT